MRHLLAVLLICNLPLTGADAAEFVGDQLIFCSKPQPVAAELRPLTLLNLAPVTPAQGNNRQEYERMATAFESTLGPTEKADPETQKFLARIRRLVTASALPAPGSFNVKADNHEVESEVFFESSLSDKIVVSCKESMSRHANMAAVSLMTGWMLSQDAESLERSRKVVAVIDQQSKDHEALLGNGLPMWPWELWLNGLRLSASDSDRLFKTQWIVARPTAGFEINTRDRASANLNVSVGVEPLGFVHYLDDSYKSWWGASLLVTSSNGSGMGVGGLLRWNNYVLGVTRHESGLPGVSDSNFVFIGVELRNFLEKSKEDFDNWKVLQNQRLQSLNLNLAK